MIVDKIYKCSHCGQQFTTASGCKQHELECSKLNDSVRHTLVVTSIASGNISFEKGSVHRRQTAESDVFFNTFMGEIICDAWMPADRPDDECRMRLLEAALKVFGTINDKLAAKMSKLRHKRKGDDANDKKAEG